MAHVDAVSFSQFQDFGRSAFGQMKSDANGVKEGRLVRRRLAGDKAVSQPTQPFCEYSGEQMHPLRNSPQSLRSVVARVHPSDVRQQRLRRADVACGFLAADVLLASL